MTVTTRTVKSADGTAIVYDRFSPAGATTGTVVLVGGAFSRRDLPKTAEMAQFLCADHDLTVLTYDRRGRGDSGDSPGSYDPDQECDDLAAIIDAELADGEQVSLFGWSSGAVLALRAAGSPRVRGVGRVVAFEPPFVVDRSGHVPPADLTERLHELIRAGQRARTVHYYMTRAIGVHPFFTTLLRLTPVWKERTAVAFSTAHDWALMAPFTRGEPLDTADWARVQVPVLVIAGGRSPAVLRTGARAIAAVLPHARYAEVPGLTPDPANEPLLEASQDFLTASAPA